MSRRCCDPCAQCEHEKDDARARIAKLESHRKQWRGIAWRLREALVHIQCGRPDPEDAARLALADVDLQANNLELESLRQCKESE